ncbi:MAG: transporter substrate-binding domain-containing protein, partial [Thermotogaceae bacterium]|nr:transporter substrate-binding domain-containing protein [Thermotogaceae bacterium]
MILAGIVDEIKKRGYLIVGTEATFPPFEFVDEKTKEIVGFDIDIAREIAKAL